MRFTNITKSALETIKQKMSIGKVQLNTRPGKALPQSHERCESRLPSHAPATPEVMFMAYEALSDCYASSKTEWRTFVCI